MAAPHQQEQVAALTTAIQQHKEGLAEARKELRNARRREQAGRQAILDVCFILYVWSMPSTVLALAFAEHDAKAKECNVCITSAELEHRYLSTPVGILAGIESRTGGLPKQALARASRFEKEFNLFKWIQNHNTLRGLAPSTGMVRQHLVDERVEPVASVCPNTERTAVPVSKRWVQRFRTRWSLSRGQFQQGEQLTREQIKQKVCTAHKLLHPQT